MSLRPSSYQYSLSWRALCTPTHFGCSHPIAPGMQDNPDDLLGRHRDTLFLPPRSHLHGLSTRKDWTTLHRCLLVFHVGPPLTGLSRFNNTCFFALPVCPDRTMLCMTMLPRAAPYKRTTVDAALSVIPWLKRSRYLVYRLSLHSKKPVSSIAHMYYLLLSWAPQTFEPHETPLSWDR